MSVDLNVFLDPGRMVTPAQWAQAVKDAGFEVEMDTDFDPREFSGFLPCKYKGRDTGFEYYYGVEQGAARPACLTFSTRSDYREFATSMICAAVLTSIVDGVLVDADGAAEIAAAKAVAWAKDGEAGIQRDIEEQDRPRPAPPAVAPARKPWWKLW